MTGRTSVLTTQERFWSKVSKTEDGCWSWTGSKTSGYGDFYDGVRKVSAHRYSYETLSGPIPEGLVLDHLCRNRACVNPEHLEPVTQQVNILRGTGMAARRAAITQCPQGHPYDEQNTLLKNGRRVCRTCLKYRRRVEAAQRQALREYLANNGLRLARTSVLPPVFEVQPANVEATL